MHVRGKAEQERQIMMWGYSSTVYYNYSKNYFKLSSL